MNVQYISDEKGNTTGVFIPINDWKQLKDKYHELEKTEDYSIDIPQWHKDIIDKRLKEYENNPDNVLDWEEVKDKFKLD